MAGQGVERREILRAMAMAAAASSFPGFHRWAFACEHVGATGVQVRPASYSPQFFTADEYATVDCLTDIIIPSDGTPGARAAGVSEFIDFMVYSDPGIQYRFRFGLTWLDAHSQKFQSRRFAALTAEQQREMLEHLAYKERFRPEEEEGRAFFNLLREYTIMGFYTSRVGLEQLDYPGLKLYSESPGCPHPGDPEHRNLPPPRF